MWALAGQWYLRSADCERGLELSPKAAVHIFPDATLIQLLARAKTLGAQQPELDS